MTTKLIEFLQKFRLPINRGDKDVYVFLNEHFQDFEKSLNFLLNTEDSDDPFEKEIFDTLKQNQTSIYDFSQTILDSLQAYRDGDSSVVNIFENKMREVQDRLLSSYMNTSNGLLNRFFRIRPYKESEKCDEPKELFHIPFEKAHFASSCRYSIAKFPCLYLSGSPTDTALSLAWFETNRPPKFWWSEFQFSNYREKIELIDFTLSPFSNAMIARNYQVWIINKEPIVQTLLVNYLITYPLIAACSLSVLDKNQSLIPEYIIPQMLLAWIHTNERYRGIKYYSCANFEMARQYSAFNVVLPPQKDIPSTGYCPKLKCEFKVSKPELMEVSDFILLQATNSW